MTSKVEEMIEKQLGEQDGADKFIKALGDTNWGSDNEAQMKAVQLLKGLATSEEPKSNEFMKKLSDASTKIAKEVLGGGE